MNHLCLIFIKFLFVSKGTELDQGAKLIEMASNKYAFITELSRAISVQKKDKDPVTAE